MSRASALCWLAMAACDGGPGLQQIGEEDPTPVPWPACGSEMFRGNPQRDGLVDHLPRVAPRPLWSTNLRGVGVGEGHPWEAGYPHGGAPEDEDDPGGMLFIGPSPVHCDDRVLAATIDGLLVALDAEDGTPLWQHRADAAIDGTPAVAGSRVVFGSLDGWLRAVDREDGTLLWRVELGSDSLASPAIVDGMVFTSTKEGRLLAVDLDDGSLRWERFLPSTVTSSTAFATNDTELVVGERSGWVRSLVAADGSVRWSQRTGGPVLATAARSGSLLAVGSWDNGLHVFDDEGRLQWIGAFEANVTASAVVDGARIIAGSWDWTVRAFARSDGTQLWAQGVDADVLASPLSDGQTVLVATETGHLKGLDAGTGAELWDLDLRGRVVATPGHGSGLLFSLAVNGDLHAFEFAVE